MTIPQAIAELEDRGVPEVIRLLERLSIDLNAKDTRISELETKVREYELGPF